MTHAPVAQEIEPWCSKPLVGGANPSGGTFFIFHCHTDTTVVIFGSSLELERERASGQEVYRHGTTRATSPKYGRPIRPSLPIPLTALQEAPMLQG